MTVKDKVIEKKRTVDVDVTYSPATRFEWILEGRKWVGYINEPFDAFDDLELNTHLHNRMTLNIGYGSNVIYLIEKETYDSSISTITKEEL